MMKRSFFPSSLAGRRAGVSIAAVLMASMFSITAAMPIPAAAQVTGSSQTTTDANGQKQESVTLNAPVGKKKKEKEEKVVQSKDTKQALKKVRKTDPLVGVDSKLPDKQLYDKAIEQVKKGHYDVARLDLQTMLNTYPDSQYQMRAKLAIADSWYKEGGTAALTQAEAEYADFRVFFPNAPEAAEAQMRIGDIYFRQMDKPDRDYAKAVHAQEEYRRMLTDYPDSVLVPDAKQRLREVQEALATRESEIGNFYSTHSNWPATIARYQTVVDSYPQYSHLDDVLVGLGDAYEAEARFVRTLKLPEAGKARLERTYDDLAAAAYRRVVLEHAASPHVEDARDRLAAMNMPIPAPTPEQVAASTALENSRRQYRLQDRLSLLILHKPDVVQAATNGEPPLTDAKPTLAPQILHQIEADFKGAFNPNAPAPKAAETTPAVSADGGPPAPAADAAPAAPLAFQDVPAAGEGGGSGASTTMTAAPAAPSGGATNSMGVEIVKPSGAPPEGTTMPTDNGGLKAVGPVNSAPLPAVEKPAAAPESVNDIPAGAAPPAQTPNANGKKGKPEFDKDDESSSKHKKKKGLGKINPF
jgi:outer membrane protein assembly factor BamD